MQRMREAQIKPDWDEVVEIMPPDVKAKRANLREQLHKVEFTAPDPAPTAYAFVNTGKDAPQAYVLRMGDPHSKLDPIDPAVPRVVQASFEIPRSSTGRRTALANWLASAGQPSNGTRDGQPHLAVPHGEWLGSHSKRLRRDGRQDAAPQPARLARRRNSSRKGGASRQWTGSS